MIYVIILSRNIIENQISPCYNRINQSTLAIYESISSHPRQDNKSEGERQEEDNYNVLNREQLGTIATMDPEIIHEEANMTNYSKLELANSEIKPERNLAYATNTHIA